MESDNSTPENGGTTQERIRYVDGEAISGRGEYEVAEAVADAIPDDWSIEISIGAYRAHSMRYEVVSDEKVVQMDFYSVHPVSGYTPEMAAADIAAGIEEATGDS